MTKRTARAVKAKEIPAGPLPDNWNVMPFPRGGTAAALDRNQQVRAALTRLDRSFNGLLDALEFLNKDHQLSGAVNAVNENLNHVWSVLERLRIVKG